ncbi:hypothetical protein ASQ44_06340 [Rickettsia rhipicephali]|nr:hypothetical protein ASQ44_06340 [Rickettsia rhipicephali]
MQPRFLAYAGMTLNYKVYTLSLKTKLLFITISGIIILYFAIPPAPLLKDVSFSQRVFDRNGELMRILLSKDDKYRIFTPIREIPASFIEAVLII